MFELSDDREKGTSLSCLLRVGKENDNVESHAH